MTLADPPLPPKSDNYHFFFFFEAFPNWISRLFLTWQGKICQLIAILPTVF